MVSQVRIVKSYKCILVKRVYHSLILNMWYRIVLYFNGKYGNLKNVSNITGTKIVNRYW